MKDRKILDVLLFFVALNLTSCGGSGGGGGSASPAVATSTVQVTWTANREKAVNQSGGGYKIYYSTTPSFSIGSATLVSAPYVSGASAPTSITISNLSPGTYYFKVVAYSALNPPGGSSGSTSTPSSEISITVL